MQSKIWRSVGYAVMVIQLAACSSVIKLDPTDKPVLGLTEKNDGDFNTQFKAERSHLGGITPTLGLALSGGGTKAAAFAHGVLHGLNGTGLLDQVDIISTASGGSYAAYWYFSKRLEASRVGFDYHSIFADCFPYWWDTKGTTTPLGRMFLVGREVTIAEGGTSCNNPHHFDPNKGDPYRWQAHILRWPDVFGTSFTRVEGGQQSAPTKDQVALGLSAAIEILFSWTGMDSNLAQSYQYGIERTWGLNPKPRTRATVKEPESSLWTFTNDGLYGQMLRVESATMQWKDLQALYRTEKSLPLWILNANAGSKGFTPDLRNLYEITPFGNGSVHIGFRDGLPPSQLKDIATAVRASAAFVDSQGLNNETQAGLLALAASFVPAASWGITVEPDPGKKVRLSDGGGADNLGLVSLVKRGLKDIIVVDAAQDGKGLLDDLCWAKEALHQEKLKLNFNALENFESLCKAQFDKSTPGLVYNTSAWLNPVVQGTITWGNTDRVTNVWLVKAAWDEQSVRVKFNELTHSESTSKDCGSKPGQINCLLLGFYGHSTDFRARDTDHYMIFPQHTTAGLTANNSSYSFIGYRELGRMAGALISRDGTKRISILADRACLQPSHPVPKENNGNRKPENYSYTKRQASECVSLLK